jgi:hypothetical protein
VRKGEAFVLGAAGGAIGAVVNTALATWLGRSGLAGALGVSLHLSWTTEGWLHRVGFGALYGLAYPLFWILLPPGALRAAVLYSALPSAVSLLYFLPHSGAGMLGLSKGALAPLVVIALNAVWGLVLGLVCRRQGTAG